MLLFLWFFRQMRFTRHNRIERIVCDLEGNEKRREFVTENHAFLVYNPLLEGPQN